MLHRGHIAKREGVNDDVAFTVAVRLFAHVAG
jgi:hypothetical protein